MALSRPRALLHEILKGLTPNVYFQPPENLKLQYPCIIYKRDYAETEYASNLPYSISKRYQIIVVDQNPDSLIPDAVAQLPMCSFNRFYTSDKLNHDVYNIYF